MPNPPPAFVRATFGCPAGLFCASRYATPRHMNDSHTVPKSAQKTTVDFSVHSQNMKVTMNQPKICNASNQRNIRAAGPRTAYV